MATLDEITKEKQQLSEALARVDAQREKLIGQLSEVEATERVLTRYSMGAGPRTKASAKTAATPTRVTAAAQSRRPRTKAARPAGRKARTMLARHKLAAIQ